jgi:tetratricopeptide (TPR) repeat protein
MAKMLSMVIFKTKIFQICRSDLLHNIKLLLVFILKLFHLFKAAKEYIEKALELDPQQGEWHFLYGKCLGRIRRIDNFNAIPSQKELKALEDAAKMTKNASYIIFLAQAYRETSFRVFSIHRNDLAPLKEKLDTMSERSAELYRYV